MGGTRDTQLNTDLAEAHRDVNAAQRRLLDVILECDRAESWLGHGCRDLAHWLSQQLGISNWAARRWINAAHTLPHLPFLNRAFLAGTLCLDKVLELCRFALPDTEEKLIRWARKVTVSGIRSRADRALRAETEEVVEAERWRSLKYWYADDGKRMGLEAWLPAEQGAAVVKAIDHLAETLPEVEPDEDTDPEASMDARRADALVALATNGAGSGASADAPLVVMHVETSTSAGPLPEPVLEDGPVVHPHTAHRLMCDCKLQVVAKRDGLTVGIGNASRKVPRWLWRLVKYRDGRCTFPGCESARYLHAHHIRHWAVGGPTDLDNLVLVCTFHHKLVHEYGWGVELAEDQTARWFKPDGSRFHERPPPERALLSA